MPFKGIADRPFPHQKERPGRTQKHKPRMEGVDGLFYFREIGGVKILFDGSKIQVGACVEHEQSRVDLQRHVHPLAFDEQRRPKFCLRSPLLRRAFNCHARSARFMGQCP
jgi:hypothetical protein